MIGLIIFIVLSLALLFFLFFYKRKTKKQTYVPPSNLKDLLMEHVAYYRGLSETDQHRFELRLIEFLSHVRIHGIKTEVEDLDKILVACSAIIPVFGFGQWRYYNLSDVLLYADAFSRDEFSITDPHRDTLGMVGTGPMQRMMILSKPALRMGFQNEWDKSNLGIHEFVHLLDKSDGDTDGIPETLLQKQYTIPWIKYMSEAIHSIKEGNSDINIYGATNQAEFFAVAAEYFFERPDLFQINHPELFSLMEKIFNQKPTPRFRQELE